TRWPRDWSSDVCSSDLLGTVRGLARSTIQEHQRSAAQLLAHLAYDTYPARLTCLTASAVEAFVCCSGARLGRATQQHYIAHVRKIGRASGRERGGMRGG